MKITDAAPVKLRDAYMSRLEPESQHVLARVYWSLCILVLIGMITGSVAYGAWEFWRPPAEAPEASVTVGARKALSRAELQKVLQAFDERTNRFEERLTAPVPVKDPSI